MLEMIALASESFTPLVSSRVGNVLVTQDCTELNQPLYQFISAVHVCLVNTLLHGRRYLIVAWVEVWAV